MAKKLLAAGGYDLSGSKMTGVGNGTTSTDAVNKGQLDSFARIDATYSIVGTLTVGAGTFRYYNDTGRTLTITAIRASVGTAPTGASILVDVNKNGTTLFTTQGNRPAILASANSAKVTNMDVTSWADGEWLTVDVDAIGSIVAGANLTVQVLC